MVSLTVPVPLLPSLPVQLSLVIPVGIGSLTFTFVAALGLLALFVTTIV